jgi:hypothetical protein
MSPVQDKDPHQGGVDWKLTEDGFSKGYTLSYNKALLGDPPEDEANSEKTKKTKIGKGRKCTDNSKK